MAQVKIHRKATYGRKMRSPPKDDLVGKAVDESPLKYVFDISDLAPCDELPVLGKDLESADKHPLKQSELFLSGQDNLETEWTLFRSGLVEDQMPCFHSLDKMPPTASDSIFGLASECKKVKSSISPEKERPDSVAAFSFSGNLSDFLSSISIEDGDDTKRSSFSSDLKSDQQNNISLSDLFKGANVEFTSSGNSEKGSNLSCSLGSSYDSSVSTSLSVSPQSVEYKASNNFQENVDEEILNFNLPTVDRESCFLDWSVKEQKCEDNDDIMLDLLQSIELTTPSIFFVRDSAIHRENNEDGLQDLLDFSNTTKTEKENTNDTSESDQPQADNVFSIATPFSSERLSPIIDLSQCLKKDNINENNNVDIAKDAHVESPYQNHQDLNSELIITPHGIESHEANNSTKLIPNSNQTLFSMSLSCKIRQNKEAKQKALRIQREMYSNLLRWTNLSDLKPKPLKRQLCIEELTIHSNLKSGTAIGRYKYGSCT